MNEIKEKLLQMQQEMLHDIDDDREKSESAVTHDIGDSIDIASEERDREFYQLLGERDRVKLQQIKEALARIEDDEYGSCESCGDEIAKPRLYALPFAKLCIDCKSEEERTKGTDLNLDNSSGFGGLENGDV